MGHAANAPSTTSNQSKQQYELLNELQLIKSACEGNELAFKELFQRHATKLYRFLRQFSVHHDYWDVEEWTQRAFIKAFQRLSTFNSSSSFKSWLFSIGIREMLSDKRTLKTSLESLESDCDVPDEPDLSFENAELLKFLLEQTSEHGKMVFLLYEIEGYSHAEIAEILTINESSSRSILTRTKQKLKTLMNNLYV